ARTAAAAPSALTMRLVGARRQAAAIALDALPGVTNYVIGSDPGQWKTGIRGYRRIQYRDVYPGVDLIYYGNDRQLEYDFIVAPGSTPREISIAFDGATSPRLGPDGSLVIATDRGELIQRPPTVYQETDGIRQSIVGRFRIDKSGRVGFRIGSYDRRRPLIIDPTLAYSTYLGG